MAVYHHVADKRQLLALVTARTIGTMIPPDPAASWDTRVRQWAIGYWELVVDHRELTLAGLADPAIAAGGLPSTEPLISAIADSGLRADLVEPTAFIVVDAVHGAALSVGSINRHDADDPTTTSSRLRGGVGHDHRRDRRREQAAIDSHRGSVGCRSRDRRGRSVSVVVDPHRHDGTRMNASGSHVVGLDNGGTANKFTVMDREGNFLIDRLVELPSRVTEGPTAAIEALRDAFEAAIELAGVDRRRGARGRLRHAGTSDRRRGDLVAWRHQLRAWRLEGVRLPYCTRGRTRPAGRLQQRRQCRRAVRPSPALRGDRRRAVVDLGDRRHGPRRRRDRERTNHQGRGRDGGRTRTRPHPDGRSARRGATDTDVQLRLRR